MKRESISDDNLLLLEDLFLYRKKNSPINLTIGELCFMMLVREYVQYSTFFLLHFADIANDYGVPIRPFFVRNLHTDLCPVRADVNIEMLRIFIEFFWVVAALETSIRFHLSYFYQFRQTWHFNT